jgi:hypothetical protein
MDVYNTADVEEYNTEDVEEDDQCDCRCCGSCMDAMGSISRVTNLEQRMIQLIAQVSILTLSEDHCRLRRCGCCTKDVVWREFERWWGLRLLDDQMLRLQQVVVAELENRCATCRWMAMVRNLQADVTQLQILVCEQMNLLRDDKYVSSLESTSRRQARIYFATTSKN